MSDNDSDKKICEGCEVLVNVIIEIKEKYFELNVNNIEGNVIKNIDISVGNEFF